RQEKAKRLMSKLGADLEDLLREAIVIEAPGSASTEEQRNAARKIIYDRRMAQLAAIQESTDTYLVDPRTTVVEIPGATNGGADDSSSSSRFDEFVGEFSLDERQEEVALMLKEDNSVVAQMHKTLVEEKKVTEQEFWTRYFYRVWLVDQEEVRRKKLVEAAVAAAVEEDFSWENEEEEEEEEAKPSTTAELADKPAQEQRPETVPVDEQTQSTSSNETPAADNSISKPNKEEAKAGDDAWDEWE
ncbi:hypothetical protein GGI21_002024, partial [Coemansia aciculifera]